MNPVTAVRDALAHRACESEIDHDGARGATGSELHEDVCRLQVSVRDVVRVRVLHRFAHKDKELETPPEVELLAITERCERHAVNELHHEVGLACHRRAEVEHRGEVGMLQLREDFLLLAEP